MYNSYLFTALFILFIAYMQLLVFLALYLNLAGPAELLNPRRQKFFGTNSANRQNSNETYGTPKATKLKRAPPVFQGFFLIS